MMKENLANLRIRFPSLTQSMLKKIYRCRLERIKTLTRLGLPEDICWIIEAKVRLAGEFPNSRDQHLPGMGRSSYSKKRRAKRMEVCYKCARWTCNSRCKGKGMISENREDKIQFIKDGLSKESLDNILQTLETHPCGQVHRVLLALADLFHKEKERYQLKNLSLSDSVCQFIEKLDKKENQQRSICRTRGRDDPESSYSNHGKELEVSSKPRFSAICVFGGSRRGKDNEFLTTANALGKVLAARGIQMVYGGGIHGLKGCAAAAAIIEGSRVLGIVIKELAEDTHDTYTYGTEIRVSTMHERFGHMLCYAEAFIALPGGLDTLEGIASVAFWTKFLYHRKPLGLLNINGFYDGLLSFLDQAVEHGFLPLEARRAIITDSNPNHLINRLQILAFHPHVMVKQVALQPPSDSKKRKADTILQLFS